MDLQHEVYCNILDFLSPRFLLQQDNCINAGVITLYVVSISMIFIAEKFIQFDVCVPWASTGRFLDKQAAGQWCVQNW